jgi:hypothetical protein
MVEDAENIYAHLSTPISTYIHSNQGYPLNTKSTYDSHPKPLSITIFQFSEQEHIKTYVAPKPLRIERVYCL